MMWSYFHPLKAIYSKIDVFFFKDTATTEIYTLSLHDALPISFPLRRRGKPGCLPASSGGSCRESPQDRKSTRLNSSHMSISHAVFCLQTTNSPRLGRILAAGWTARARRGRGAVSL